MKPLLLFVGAFAAFALAGEISAGPKTTKTSGVYLSAAEYENNRLSFEGDCGSKVHKLELHDVLNKPYIDVTHASEKRRYSKRDLFGFRACDGHDYRLESNLEYRILETRELYIYVREIKTRGKGFHTDIEYYFSVGAEGPILALTLENLKQAVPENHRFHDSLEATFRARQKLQLYDEYHRMFHVNWLLIASREHEP
jgi:hypothetical protein